MRKIGIGAIVLVWAALGCAAQTTRWSEERARGVVCEAAVAGGQQLHSRDLHQRTGNVAGRDV